MADYVGQQLGGRYRLLRLIGDGGFAQVYLGEDIYLEKQVAVKVRKDLGNLTNEARILHQVQHEHIVKLIDYGETNNIPFLVMEYISNSILQLHPRGTQLPLVSIVSYVKQIAAALQHMHNSGIIHGDIHPEKLLLRQDGTLVLIGFDLASDARGIGSTYARPSTYMSPEQKFGIFRPSGDQYSLGVIAYEWLTGTRPLEKSFTEIIVRQRSTPIAPAITQVVLKAQAFESSQRFASIQEFAVAFERASGLQQPFEIALSYASEDRKYASALASILKSHDVKVFYDQYEKPVLWGKDLYIYLSELYQHKASYCVVFLSHYYAAKMWTKHELQAAQARALSENKEYILPIRLDDSEIPGVLPTIAYLDWRHETLEGIAALILEKLGR